MRVLFALILTVFLVGCSAEAASDRTEAQILASLNDKVWDNNPEMILSKCYPLSEEGKKACYRLYFEKMSAAGKDIPDSACSSLKIC